MKNSKIVKITSAILATVIVGTTFFAYFRVPAGAFISLNNIENIKATKQNGNLAFNIVEIAPSENYGTMGYYVKGQEPQMISNWLKTIARMSDPEERTNYANNVVFGPLISKGLAAYNDSAPITVTGVYEEHYPWDTDFYTGEYNTKATQLQLSEKSKFNLTKAKAEEYTEGSREGFNYTMDYIYRLISVNNLFDFAEWFNKRRSTFNEGDEYLEMNNGTGSFIYDESSKVLTITNNDTASNYMKFQGGNAAGELYSAGPLNVGESYKFYYRTDFKKADDFDGELKSKVRIFFRDSSGSFNSASPDEELEETEEGVHSFSFVAEKQYMTIQLGIEGKGEVALSGFSLYLDNNAYYAQNVDKFVYGEAEDAYGSNIFNLAMWADNSSSMSLVNKTPGDYITVNREDGTIAVRSDSEGEGDVYTSYTSPDAYFMNVEPGATYEIQFKVKVTGNGQAKTRIAAFKSGLTELGSLTPQGGSAVDTYTSLKANGNTETVRFTVKGDTSSTNKDGTRYIKLGFGTSDKNTTVTYSNIRLRKLDNSQIYYYDIEETDSFYSHSNADEKLPPEGTILYTRESIDGGYKYVYAGAYSPTDRFGFHITAGVDYYTVDVKLGTTPSLSKDDDHPYYAVANTTMPFKTATPGFFERLDGDLTYVGENNDAATHKIVFTNNANDKLTVNSSVVYYMGGFENNNWFKYNVLDADDKNADGTDVYTFPIMVSVIRPDDPDIESKVKYADLVVISSGLNLGSAVVPSYPCDLADGTTILELVKQKKQDKDAFVVDSSLDHSSTPANLRAVVQELIGGVTGGVNGGVYAFKSIDVTGDNLHTLANKDFYTNSIPCGTNETTSDYYPVRHEIDQENEIIRKVYYPYDQSKWFTGNKAIVSEATCIRYVLNYKKQRLYEMADKIMVLDIEPASSNPTLDYAKLNALMPEQGLQWSSANCEIIGMSVTEFVAKNEDFAEQYDIIYIGASTDNLPKTLKKGDTFTYAYTDNNGREQTVQGKIFNDGQAHIPNYNQTHPENMTVADKAAEEAYKQLEKTHVIPRVREGDPVYNDPHMTAMYYTNVGDKIETANKEAEEFTDLQDLGYVINPAHWDDMIDDLTNPPALGGMLKEDYLNWGDKINENGGLLSLLGVGDALKTQYLPLGGHATMRASGNDLNEAAMKRLQHYVNSGRTVIVDDKLIKKGLNTNLHLNLSCDDIVAGRPVTNGSFYNNDTDFANKFTVNVITDDGIDLMTNPDYSTFAENFTYHWYYRAKDSTNTTDLGTVTGNNGKIMGYNTNNMVQEKDSQGNPVYNTITRYRRKRIGWTLPAKYEYIPESNIKVPKYRTEPTGLGTYWCEVTFTYGGAEYRRTTNSITIDKTESSNFVARFYSEAHFATDNLIQDSNNYNRDFHHASYRVEFFELTYGIPKEYLPSYTLYTKDAGGHLVEVPASSYNSNGDLLVEHDNDGNQIDYYNASGNKVVFKNSSNQEIKNAVLDETNVTHKSDGTGIQDKFDVHYEWWDEADTIELKCHRHKWNHLHTMDYSVLLSNDNYYSNFGNPSSSYYRQMSGQIAHLPDAGWLYGHCTEESEWFDLSLTPSSTDNGRELVNTNCNRVICRMTFYVGGKANAGGVPIIFKTSKQGGPLTTVFVSRSIGPYDGKHLHEDHETYPYCELYEVKKVDDKNGNTQTFSSESTNSPEYSFNIANIKKEVAQTVTKPIPVTAPSEASVGNIDNCSYMWRFIVSEYYDHRSNMFAYDDALHDDSKLTNALSVPRLHIEMAADSAKEYDKGLESESLDGSNLTLRYYIVDKNEYFKESTFSAVLYIDTDGDGRFSESEKVTTALNQKATKNTNSGKEQIQHDLNSDTKGIIPWKIIITEDDRDGLDREPVHTSYSGYAYKKPAADDPILINALMVLPGAWNPAEWTNMGKPYLNIENEVKYKNNGGKKLTIFGQGKEIKDNYWSENEYIGPVFAADVFDHLEGPTTRRFTEQEYADQNITLTTVQKKTVNGQEIVIGGCDDGSGHEGVEGSLYHLGFVVNDGDIKIMITCVSIHQLNKFYGYGADNDSFGEDKWSCTNSACANSSKQIKGMYCPICHAPKLKTSSKVDFLTRYNMLILGFGDSWGKLAATFLDILGNQTLHPEGLSNYTSLAIRNYINEDKAVLFCHDTTNKSVDFLDLYIDKLKNFGTNLWSNMMQIGNAILGFFGVGDYFDTLPEQAKLQNTKIAGGYWNNLVLRDALGLDRYGITQTIISRSEAIINNEVSGESQFASNKKDPFDNKPLGRAHMYNYLYNGYVTEGDINPVTAITNEEGENVTVDNKGNPKDFVTNNHTRDLTVKRALEGDEEHDLLPHSVAWVPGTADTYPRGAGNQVESVVNGKTVYEGEPVLDSAGNVHARFDRYTQGFTDYTIARYINPNNTSQLFPSQALVRDDLREGNYQRIYSTDKVTQLNGGKITTYPYDINVEETTYDGHPGDGFAHSTYDMNQTKSVELTHEQVYQCNMNGDDITVWYALAYGGSTTRNEGFFWKLNSDGTITGKRNDAPNAYYMFSRGNITYTGAGHKNKFTEFEAKLFINTLVAAYREEYTKPSVSYRDSQNTKTNRYLLMIPEADESGVETLVPEDFAYFVLRDSNVGTKNTDVTNKVEFYYLDENGNEVDITNKVKLYNVSGNGPLSYTGKGFNQNLIHFAIPQEVIDLFYTTDSEGNKVLNSKMSERIYCRPYSIISKNGTQVKGSPFEGVPSYIEVRKLDQSDLG